MDNTSFAPGNNSINNSVPSPMPQYSAPEPKHFLNKKFAITFGILILIGAGAYAGIWYWGNQQVPQEVMPTFTPRASVSATPNTSTWKTYTNTQYGFEFKYPPRFKIKNLTDVSIGALEDLEFYNDQTQSLPGELPLLFNLYIMDLGQNKNITDAIKTENPKYSSLISQKTIGQETYFRSQINYANGTSLVSYYLGLGSNRYLGFGAFDAKSDLTPELLQILSTFKFTSVSSIIYQNNQYGFSIALPDSWKGYTVLNSQWEGRDVATGKVTATGPIITLRHPLWTTANPGEDMPVMIFTPAQWALIQSEKLAVSAAPIPPSVLGQNSKYIITLPARYNYDYKTGWEEVDQLVHNLKAFEPTK